MLKAEKSSDVFQNKELEKEEERKVDGVDDTKGKDQVEAYEESSSNITDDGSDNDWSHHECPNDRRMRKLGTCKRGEGRAVTL